MKGAGHKSKVVDMLSKNFIRAVLFLSGLMPVLAFGAEAGVAADFTGHWTGIACLVIFVLAYTLVVLEEHLHLRKSKPVMIAAGLIWALVAYVFTQHGDFHTAEEAVRHNLLEYVELFLFLLAAMTYINTMDERGVFKALRGWLVSRGFSLRSVFWITGLLAFFISPVADNLTTALLMTAVVITVAGNNPKFVTVSCINVVVAANAGGAFSPFGDITTLMVWQKGVVEFHEFFDLFIPSVVNWIVPAAIMSLTIPKQQPDAVGEQVELKYGAFVVIGLFILTIVMAVCGHNFLHLPPVIGMMMGLGLLKVYGYHLTRYDHKVTFRDYYLGEDELDLEQEHVRTKGKRPKPFNIFKSIEKAEWDTLMFFYGIILCVGGLGTLGYLAQVSQLMYVDLGHTEANVLVGLLSSIIDNIPVMFAVLTMNPDMSHGQWLLVTLTAGVGGSLLSIGSAAGVAVMGQARGIYTFFAHLKWTWAIALGYALSIWVHMILNAELFHVAV